MKRLRFPGAHLIIVGLSSGDIVLIQMTQEKDGLKTKNIGTLKRVHDFGVNSLDAVTVRKRAELVNSQSQGGNYQVLIASGGDDQHLAVHNMLIMQ